MTTSRYEHIQSEQVFELPDTLAAGLTGFRKVEEAVAVPAPKPRGRKPKTNSSKEGN